MQRGVIELTKIESRLAEMLAENSGADLTSLRAKLQLALASALEIDRLEVNREEVEAILDAFPEPGQNQDPSYLSLGNKLRGFLQ